MKPKDLFGVIVRVIGLLTLTSWMYFFIIMVLTADRASVMVTVPFLLVGAYLLRGAPGLVDWSYAREDNSPRAQELPDNAIQADTPPRSH
jgi:hypothetical protein